MKPKTVVSFENYDFDARSTGDEPAGLDVAEFFVDELSERGFACKVGDFLDFYAHTIECNVGRRRFTLTIGFIGDDQLLLQVEPWLPRILHFVGINTDREIVELVKTINEILAKHGFESVKWWTSAEWSGPQKEWSSVPL